MGEKRDPYRFVPASDLTSPLVVTARLARRYTRTGTHMAADASIPLGTLYLLDLAKQTILRTTNDPDCTEVESAVWAKSASDPNDPWGWMPKDLFDVVVQG